MLRIHIARPMRTTAGKFCTISLDLVFYLSLEMLDEVHFDGGPPHGGWLFCNLHNPILNMSKASCLGPPFRE